MDTSKHLLKDLKSLLSEQFGDNVSKVLLFGSRAKGKNHQDSDYDVLILLNEDYNWTYKDKIIEAIYEIELAWEVFIDVKVISKNELEHSIKGQNPLYEDAINEGVIL